MMKKIVTLLTLLYFTSSTSFAASQSTHSSAEVKTFVNQLGLEIIAIAKEKKTNDNAKKEKIIAVIDNAIDSNWIARFVLGKHYRTSNDVQKQRFTALYREFMINTYGPKFKDYNGSDFKVIDVIKESRFFLAKAEFLPANSTTPILVDFRVKERKGRLFVLDFIAEGISLIETQRSEFNSAISQQGMDQFLDSLAVRVKKLKAGK